MRTVTEPRSDDVNIQQILERVTGDSPVQKVFGEPVERDGVVCVPVATVFGAGGGGSATGHVPGADGPGEGGGGGFTFSARPVGVYVIKDGDAHWRPAVEVNRAILGGQLLGLVLLLVIRSVLRRHR
jgi:uncharacterized spore protein YtfJ